MFRRLLTKLFPSLVKEQSKETNYYYFEESRQSTETHALHETNVKANVETDALSIEELPKRLSVQSLFFDLCLSPSIHHVGYDSVSALVEHKISKLLGNPKHIVSALPIVPKALSAIIDQLQSPEFDVEAIISLINQDPIIAAKVIELANSARYNRSGKEVTSVKNAFMLLGKNGLAEGVINGFIGQVAPKNQIYYKNYGRYIWQHSQMTGIVTQELARIGGYNESEAYLSGLLTNLGSMIIFQLLIDAFGLISPDEQPNSANIRNLVNKYGAKLTLDVARMWKFPRNILEPLAAQNKIVDRLSLTKFNEKYPMAALVFEAKQLAMVSILIENQRLDLEQFDLTNELSLQSSAAKNYDLGSQVENHNC